MLVASLFSLVRLDRRTPVDQEKLTVKYPDAFTLMESLRGMGEQSADLRCASSVRCGPS